MQNKKKSAFLSRGERMIGRGPKGWGEANTMTQGKKGRPVSTANFSKQEKRGPCWSLLIPPGRLMLYFPPAAKKESLTKGGASYWRKIYMQS